MDKSEMAQDQILLQTPNCAEHENSSDFDETDGLAYGFEQYKTFGLGRGIDATHPKPWQNISSFEIVEVTAKNVVETDGVAVKEDFLDDIKSMVDKHAEIHALTKKSGIASIGIFAENSRSTKKTKKVVGSRVLTRTITFRSSFANIPLQPRMCTLPANFSRLDSSTLDNQHFEKKLCAWILQCIEARQIHDTKRINHNPVSLNIKSDTQNRSVCTSPCSSNPISQLSDYMSHFKEDSSELKAIAKDCDSFVRKGYGGDKAITHYVYQLQLGAMEYKILTEDDYNSKVHIRGELSGENPEAVEVEAGGSFSQLKTNEHRSARGKSIGKIRDDTVEKGTEDEKVIGIEIKPIHTLVNNLPYLRQVLMEAESKYIQENQLEERPFLIWCNEDSKIYLKVHERSSVVGTLERKEASTFYLQHSTNEEDTNEFSIVYKNYSGCKQCRFLTICLNRLGHSSGPLEVKEVANNPDHDAFTLHSQRPNDEKDPSVHIKSWENGPFFFKCANRNRGFDGYIAMTKQRQAGFEYTTKCVRQKSEHNKPHTWLLFHFEHQEEEKDGETEEERRGSNQC